MCCQNASKEEISEFLWGGGLFQRVVNKNKDNRHVTDTLAPGEAELGGIFSPNRILRFLEEIRGHFGAVVCDAAISPQTSWIGFLVAKSITLRFVRW